VFIREVLELRMIIVTSYRSPDLDGIACSIAYSELLNKLGKDTKASYYGKLGLEVEFVKKYTNYFPIEKHDGKYNEGTKFILVDTSDPEAIEPTIAPEKVIEIFDHRQLVFVEKFVNAKKTIQLVGSCATLITEEFQKNKMAPSENSAIYLYSAIVSNTINFKNLVTTERDKTAADWLKSFISLPNDYLKRMFSSKSNINSNNLYEVISQDFAVKAFNNKVVGIAQTDILKGFNIFYPVDEKSREFFSKVLEVPDLKPGYKTKEIIMRKQIWPKIERVLV
jgi:manganese-dependent inorganic pyrophosphatase